MVLLLELTHHEVLLPQLSPFHMHVHFLFLPRTKWDKVFKSGPSKFCERQLLKNLKGYGLFNFLKAVFHKFYLVHSWILCPKYTIIVSLKHFQNIHATQPTFPCSKSTIETLEKGMKYVSYLFLMFLLLTLNK